MVKSVFVISCGSYRRAGRPGSFQAGNVMTRVFLSWDVSQERPYIAGFATSDPLSDSFLFHSREWTRNKWNDHTPQTWPRLNATTSPLIAKCQTLEELNAAMAKFECGIRRKPWYRQLPEMSRHYSRVIGVSRNEGKAKIIMPDNNSCFEPSAP